MRTILVPTDFSEPAENAAHYALNLAVAMKTDIHLCHAVAVPIEDPALGGSSWALHEYPHLQEAGNAALERLVQKLENGIGETEDPASFRPKLSYACELGDTAGVINTIADRTNAVLIVMGMTGVGKLNRFIFGSSSIRMINSTKHPLLIIPYNQQFKDLEKIAFSTDLTAKDRTTADALAKFAGHFNAELMIAHIPNFIEIIDENEYQQRKDLFLKDLEGKISYLSVESDNIDSGLEVIKNKDIDMLVMGHEHRGFFDRLIFGSYAVRHASEVKIPLLIIPDGAVVAF